VVGLLTLAVIGMGFALFLAEPETLAAGPPEPRPVATFVPAALWTATPSDATSPVISPTPCNYPQGWVAYEVQVADTLTSLAERYGMSVAEIADANCLTRRVISAGQVLYFPPSLDTTTPVPGIIATESVTLTP
jgi:hypothetical protein